MYVINCQAKLLYCLLELTDLCGSALQMHIQTGLFMQAVKKSTFSSEFCSLSLVLFCAAVQVGYLCVSCKLSVENCWIC